MHETLTSELLWRAAAFTAALDAILVLLASRVRADRFERLGGPLTYSAGAVFAVLWGCLASVAFWDEVYSHLFPAWSRWLLPLVYGLLFAGLARGFWSLARRARRWPAVWFIVLGGLVSLVGHGIGMARGLMRVPLLASASPLSALVFGVFEFVVYFWAITALALLVDRLRGGGSQEAEPSQTARNKT